MSGYAVRGWPCKSQECPPLNIYQGVCVCVCRGWVGPSDRVELKSWAEHVVRHLTVLESDRIELVARPYGETLREGSVMCEVCSVCATEEAAE